MKIKTSELTGVALDWAVAKCENADWSDDDCIVNVTTFDEYAGTICNYSIDWAQGGPIIEREGIGLLKVENRLPHQQWDAGETDEFPNTLWAVVSGPTPLIAAMRCYVASKLGDEVEIPDELIHDKEGRSRMATLLWQQAVLWALNASEEDYSADELI